MSAAELAQVVDELPAELAEYVETPEDKSGEQATDQVVDEQIAADPLVEKAQKGGWTDKEAWVAAGKDADEWIDAKEFVSRKPLYDQNRALKKALKDRDEKIEAVTKYASKVAENTRNKVLAELEAKKLQAVEIGDVDGYKAVEKEIEEVRKDDLPEPVTEKAEVLPDAVTDFTKRNDKWFEKDKAMTVFMVESTREYTAAGKPLDEAIKLAEIDVKKEFAHKFVNPNKGKAAAVGSGNNETRGAVTTYADLDAGQRQVWSALKGKMTFEEFVKDLKSLGELK